MNQFDTIVQEQLILLDESWKKYATGAALGASALLGFQQGNKDTQHNYDLTKSKMTQQQNVGSFSPSSTLKSTPSKATPSKANSKHTIKAKHNINEYKVGLMARFYHNSFTGGAANKSLYNEPTYQYVIKKEIGDMYPNYQMVKIYNYDTPVVTITFSKDGSEITNIIKKPNLFYPEKMKGYIKSQFGIDL
jgi:hypothetical protein